MVHWRATRAGPHVVYNFPQPTILMIQFCSSFLYMHIYPFSMVPKRAPDTVIYMWNELFKGWFLAVAWSQMCQIKEVKHYRFILLKEINQLSIMWQKNFKINNKRELFKQLTNYKWQLNKKERKKFSQTHLQNIKKSSLLLISNIIRDDCITW